MMKKSKLQISLLLIICSFLIVILFLEREKPASETADSEVQNQNDAAYFDNTNLPDAAPDLNEKTETGVSTGTEADSMEALETTGTIEALVPGDIVSNAMLETIGTDNLFYSTVISPEIESRIAGISYQENDNIVLSDLRYIRVLYYGFDGKTHIGELIVNQKIEADLLEIMKELYENQYPIEKMVLIDEYDADDESSMEDNNTCAFNYRSINGSTKLSKHSLGLAIDINPRFNPCVRTIDGELSIEPANGTAYTDRTQEFPYKITENDLCYRLFTEHGFTWGGSWNSLKDYQHFEKDI